MKKQNINYSQLGIALMLIIAISFSLAIFTPSFAQKAKSKMADTDTTKTTRSYSYEKVIIDSNGNKKVISKTVNSNDGGDVQVSFSGDDFAGSISGDFTKAISDIALAATEIATAVSKIDKEEVAKEMAHAGKEMESAQKEMRLARKEMIKAQKEVDAVDWEQVRAEINKGLAEADKALNDPELKKEIAMEIRRGLEEGKAALEEAKAELRKQRVSVSVTSDDNGPAPATPENNFDEMLDKMEREGLIDRKRGFNIVKSENGTLIINNEIQPKSVFKHYSQYLDANNIVISGKKGKLSITVNN